MFSKKNDSLVAIIIQARMSSTRLPGKSLMDICGKPLIWHVVERARRSKEAKVVVLATTVEKSDDPLYEFFDKSGIVCFRGDLDDVLKRYYDAAKSVNADIVVRITGDSPLVDPKLIDDFVKILKSGNYDYVSNGKQPWMDGFDVEVFTFAALEKAYNEAAMASEREHVTPYMKNSGKFRVYFVSNDPWFGNLQCSIDRSNDLEFVRKIYEAMLKSGKDHIFTYLDVKSLLLANPHLMEINKDAVINEGYAKSVKEDKKIK